MSFIKLISNYFFIAKLIQVELGDSIMMDKKKIILIALIIIILASCTILITSQNNTNDSDNYNLSKNNTTKNNFSNNTLENNSKNNQTTELSRKSILYSSVINNHLSNDENINKLVEVTADDVKKLVENSVSWETANGGDENGVIVGEPYKYGDTQWLVPAFNKNTGKFLGAIWVFTDTHKEVNGKVGGLFTYGTDSYSVYKDIISGKPITSSYRDIAINGVSDSNLNDVSSDDSVLRSAAPEPSNDDSNQVLDEIEETSDLNNTTV